MFLTICSIEASVTRSKTSKLHTLHWVAQMRRETTENNEKNMPTLSEACHLALSQVAGRSDEVQEPDDAKHILWHPQLRKHRSLLLHTCNDQFLLLSD